LGKVEPNFQPLGKVEPNFQPLGKVEPNFQPLGKVEPKPFAALFLKVDLIVHSQHFRKAFWLHLF
jgi:hypothetical protein